MEKSGLSYQLLTDEQFRKLFGKLTGTVDEADAGDKETLRLYRKLLGSGEPGGLIRFVSGNLQRCTSMSDVQELMAEYMQRTMSGYFDEMEFAGIGATRIVFVGKDGVALKFQYDCNSTQMEEELLAQTSYPDAQCFPRLFDYDRDEMMSAAVECCREATDGDFVKLYGHPFAVVYQTTADLAYGDEPELPDLAESISNGDEPKWRSLRDLSMFLRQHRLIDIDEVRNWGVACRDGKLVPVVIDIGL